MDLSEKLRLESTIVRLGVLTLLGTTIELIIALPVISIVLTQLTIPAPIITSNQSLFLISPAGYTLIGMYILVPTIYCVFVSLLLRPKRIVSPLNIQLGVLSIGGILVLDKVVFPAGYLIALPVPQQVSVITAFGIQMFLAGMMTVVLGFLQTIVVRWWVGFNLEELDRVSYTINDSLDFVKGQFNDSFREPFGLSEPEKNDSGMIIVSSHSANGESLVLVLRDVREPEKFNCILATVAYQNKFTVLTKTKEASAGRDAVVWALKGKCLELNSSIVFTRLEALNEPASEEAFEQAKRRTESKPHIGVQFFSSLSKEYRYAIVVTVGVLLLLPLLAVFQQVSVDTFVGTTVFVIVALFVEIGIALRGEVNRSKPEKEK